MKSKFGKIAVLVAAPLAGVLVAGCGLIGTTVAVAVGTVGVVGYSIYEGGESVVEGVSSLGGGGNDAKEGDTVVYSGKVLKAECHGTVEQVWLASATVLRQANFQGLTGDYDLLSGELGAQTWDQHPVSVKLKAGEDNVVNVSIWVGPDGDLKVSEKIFKLIRAELDKRAATARAAGTAPTPKEEAK